MTAPEPTYRCRLRLVETFHHLPTGREVALGRASSCHIPLDDELVSREHARITAHENGTAELVDLGSRNGTYVNGRRVEGTVPLRSGDTVRISFFELVFEAIPEGEVTSPATLQLVYCTGCASVLTSEMKFCVNCGRAVDREASVTCCPQCYGHVTPYMHFCTQCGHDLRAAPGG